MRRVVQVSSYYPPHLGGQENAVHDLALQLVGAGYDVRVLTSSEGGEHGSTTENGVHVKRLRGFVFGHAPIMPAFLLSLFRSIQMDTIIHLHIGQAFTPEMVWLVAKLCHAKYIAQLHIDFEPSGPAGILLPLYKKMILGHVLRSADAVVVLNERTCDIVRNIYGYTGVVRVMNNGTDEGYFALNRKSFALKPPKVLKLIFVGRLSRQKNIPELLRAMKYTKRNVHLDIIGDGDERDRAERLIEKYNLRNVTMHGRLSRDNVLRFYEKCDALIIPSLYEAQPLVLLEAMAARVPIIGADVIGVAEHIRNVGVIVEPTAEGIVNGIEGYFENYAALPDMVKRGYKRAEKTRWANTLKEYEELYEEILGN